MREYKDKVTFSSFDQVTETLKLISTHISHIFLTDKFAYKIKRPVNYGFCNFSTLRLRKKYCQKELEKNSLLSADVYLRSKKRPKGVYLEVLPVREVDGEIKFGGKQGKIIDYAVKMERLPEEARMVHLLAKNMVKKEHLKKIAKNLADFHLHLPIPKEAQEFGKASHLKKICQENFDQTEKFLGKSITQKEFDLIKKKTFTFLKFKKELFDKRIKKGKVRDCHGDLHSEAIYILNPSGDFEIKITDALEFNPAYSIIDFCADISFLTMDLRAWGREDLAGCFLREYLKKTFDQKILSSRLLPFYETERAYVRGKVACFKGDFTLAKKYFKLAAELTREF